MPVIPACRLTLAAALIIASPLAGAQTATAPAPAPVTTTTTTATTTIATGQPATATTPESKLTTQFADLAGSKENAASLVNGLRTGSAITLTSQPATGTPPGAGGTTVGTATTFTAPTKPMGYGNVRIALSLAKAQLASQGITNPTPEQLQTALVGAPGGTATGTSQPGVLQMRADGMGWGKIANTMGVKLGAVMSGKQTWPAAGTTTTTTASGVTTGAGKSSGVTTAAGSSGGKHSGITTAGGSSGSKHSGITTAGGGQGRSGVTTGLGQSHSSGMAYGHAARGGVVNAGGGSAGSMAGGGGHGQGGGKH